jgi:PAS domain S-box-containing protein
MTLLKLKDANGKSNRLRRSSGKIHREEASKTDTPSYQTLAKSMLDGAVTITPSGTILRSNLAFVEMMETPFEQMIGKSFFAFVRIGWNQRFFDFLQGSMEESQTAEIALTTGSGKEIFARLACNAFSLDSEKKLSLTVSDLRSRKKMEEALVRSTQRLETAAGLNSNAVWELDLATKEIWRNQGFASLLGYPNDAVKPTPIWWRQAVHPEDRLPVFSALEELVKTGNGTFQQNYRIRKFDGSYADVVDRAVAIRDDESNTLRIIGSIIDITDQKKAQAAKQEWSKRILHAQEQERQRMARDLHDGISQLLVSSNYRLHHVEAKIARQDKTLAKTISEVRQLVEKAQKEIQLISHNLRPSELDDLGFQPALRTLCATFQKRTGIKTTLEVEDSKAITPDVELALYRIAQEAMTNVEKHAGAKRIRLILKRNSNAINLQIFDNGKGFDPNNIRKDSEHGCGLENMRERAACFSGTVKINSSLSLGTEIMVTIPA